MRAFRSFLFVIALCCSAIFIFSCNFIYDKSVPAYLQKYTTEIVVGDVVPNQELNAYKTVYDNQGCLCIPSDKDFVFDIYHSNPDGNHNNIELYVWDDNFGDSGDYVKLGLDKNNDIYLISELNESDVFRFVFNSSFLKPFETSAGGRTFSKKFKVLDCYVPDFPKDSYFTLTFNVNTPPAFVSHQTIESIDSKAVLCLAIKNPAYYPELYSDFEQDGSNYYCFKINNKKLKFYNNSNRIYFYDENGYSLDVQNTKKTGQITIQGQPFSVSDDEIPVYYYTDDPITDNLETSPIYEISAVDTNGLSFKTIASVRPTGNAPLKPPVIVIDNDNATATITPEFSDLTNKPVTKVDIVYSTSDGITKRKTLKSGVDQNYVINLPAGKTDVSAYQSLQFYEDSETKTQQANVAKIFYVNQDSGEEYGGGNSSHPINDIRKVTKYLESRIQYLTSDETWNIVLQSDLTYENPKGVTDFISITKPEGDKKLTVNIKSSVANTKRTVDANVPSGSDRYPSNTLNQAGVIEGRNITLNLTDLIITGGCMKGNYNSNATYTGAGVNALNTDLTLTNCVVYNNVTNWDGGGIYSNKTLVLNNTKVYNNQGNGENGGGGICFVGGTSCEIKNGSIIGDKSEPNYATGKGGGLAFNSENGTLTITGSVIGTENANDITEYLQDCANKAFGTGGGIHIAKAKTVTITDSSIRHNHCTRANSYGGGIYLESGVDVTFSNSTVYHNTAAYGSGIYCNGASTITGATITANKCCNDYSSSAVFLNNANNTTSSIVSCSIKDNYGTGVWVNAKSSSITSSEIKNNFATTVTGINTVVGADVHVFNSACVTLTSNTISNSNTDEAKRSIVLDSSTPSTFTGNSISSTLYVCKQNAISGASTTSNNLNITIDSSSVEDFFRIVKFSGEQTEVGNYNKYTISNSDYYFNKNGVLYKTSEHVVNSQTSFQTIINKVVASSQENEVIIFKSNVENTPQWFPWENDEQTIRYNAGAYIKYNGNKNKYITIYGNGYHFKAGSGNSSDTSALVINTKNYVTIHDLSIEGADNWGDSGSGGYGGGINLVKGNLYLHNTVIGLQESSCSRVPGTSSSATNVAGRGGGIYITKGCSVDLYSGTQICNNYAGIGSAIYNQGSLTIYENTDIQYNYSTSFNFGATVYCEQGSSLTITTDSTVEQEMRFSNNESANVAGFYFESGVRFTNNIKGTKTILKMNNNTAQDYYMGTCFDMQGTLGYTYSSNLFGNIECYNSDSNYYQFRILSNSNFLQSNQTKFNIGIFGSSSNNIVTFSSNFKCLIYTGVPTYNWTKTINKNATATTDSNGLIEMNVTNGFIKLE